MPPLKSTRGFTLLELVAVCAVLGILAAIALEAASSQIERSRAAAEQRELERLAAAIQASFESTDLESTNLAALNGTVPAGVDVTAFSSNNALDAVPATTNAYDWFAKLARQRGDTPVVGVAPTPALQPRVAAVLINPNRQTRLLWEGPETESGQQRFLLLSVMAPDGAVVLPPWPNASTSQDPANLALFNDTWNTDWSSPGVVLPASWLSGLSAAQAAAWSGRTAQLCVRRIVCPKYQIVLNNTHPSDNCYLAYNFNGSTAGAAVTLLAEAGTVVVPGILAGRTIQAYRGSSPPPSAQLFCQFILRDQSEITLQN
jgi:prepilin-type N-terminal cleavage/methylation domain-containing protein